MARFAALKAVATLGAVGVGVLATVVLGAFDGNVHAEEAGSVQIFDRVRGVSFILKLNERES